MRDYTLVSDSSRKKWSDNTRKRMNLIKSGVIPRPAKWGNLQAVGTQRFKRDKPEHPKEWWTLVGYRKYVRWCKKYTLYQRIANQPIWKRTCVLLLEEKLRRKLSRSECLRIRYVDGDKSNCQLSNLILLPTKETLIQCVVCGKVLYHKSYKRVGNTCTYCQPAAKHSAKLTVVQVQIIKSLKNPSGLVYETKEGTLTDLLAHWFSVSRTTVGHVRSGCNWKDVKPMSGKLAWKALIDQYDILVKKSTGLLYDRVTLLKQVYEMPEYLADQRAEGKDPMELINSKLSDTCANFTELLQILKIFPKRQQWEETPLSEMRSVMLEKIRGERVPRKVVNTVRPTVGEVKELHQRLDLIQQDATQSKRQVKERERRIALLETKLEEAQAEVKRLKEENRSLKLKLKEAKMLSHV